MNLKKNFEKIKEFVRKVNFFKEFEESTDRSIITYRFPVYMYLGER